MDDQSKVSNSNVHPEQGLDSESASGLNALRSLGQIDLQPSPYLAARVKAGLIASQRETSEDLGTWSAKWKQFFWPSLSAVLALALVLVLMTGGPHGREEIATYVTGQDYLIRVDIRAVHESNVAFAEIVLQDENLQFSSRQFSDVKELRKLVIEWQQLTDKQYLPIVVQGLRAGASQVTVNFYDKNNNVILTKEMPLLFKGKNI